MGRLHGAVMMMMIVKVVGFAFILKYEYWERERGREIYSYVIGRVEKRLEGGPLIERDDSVGRERGSQYSSIYLI